MLYNIQAAVSNFEYVLSFGCLVFVVIVPVLTMRVLAEERRQKTDQLLYSLPISTTEVIIGKYAALLVLYLVPLVIISIYPLIFAQFGDGRFDERGGSPVLTAAADVDDKMLQQLLALGRVVHFRMELDAPCLLSVDLERGDRHVLRAGDDPVAFRNPDDRIPVRHPYLRPLGKVPDQRIVAFRFRQHGPSVLPRRRGSDLASVAMREVLGSVADAQQRQLALDR